LNDDRDDHELFRVGGRVPRADLLQSDASYIYVSDDRISSGHQQDFQSFESRLIQKRSAVGFKNCHDAEQ
jgi:hypothetical protein